MESCHDQHPFERMRGEAGRGSIRQAVLDGSTWSFSLGAGDLGGTQVYSGD
jgi:hypothetical protein